MRCVSLSRFTYHTVSRFIQFPDEILYAEWKSVKITVNSLLIIQTIATLFILYGSVCVFLLLLIYDLGTESICLLIVGKVQQIIVLGFTICDFVSNSFFYLVFFIYIIVRCHQDPQITRPRWILMLTSHVKNLMVLIKWENFYKNNVSCIKLYICNS